LKLAKGDNNRWCWKREHQARGR